MNPDTEGEAVFLQSSKDMKEILTRLNQLQEKVDAIDKSNKKFLMAATMGRMELLEKENTDMKKALIHILDQTDWLLSAVLSGPAGREGSLYSSVELYHRKVFELAEPFGIEKIPIQVGDPFNPKEQQCTEIVSQPDREDDTVAEIIQCGYYDKTGGGILRYAKVAVNRSEGKDA